MTSLFTQFDVFEVTRALYYPEYEQGDTYVEGVLAGIIDPRRKKQIMNLICKIDEQKEKLNQAADKSNLIQVEDIKFDYSNQISQIAREGTRLMKELSAITGLPIRHDPFANSGGGSYIYQSFP